MKKSLLTKKQINYLILNYSTKSGRELSIELKQDEKYINHRAFMLGLKKNENYDSHKNIRIGSFENLLKETPQSYYWIGFIMADGSMSKNGRLQVSSSYDKKHIESLAKFLNGKCSQQKRGKKSGFSGSSELFYSLSIMDTKNYKLIFDKFKIYNDKTYNPPMIDFLNTDWKFLSWLVGFIDGDGTVYKQKSIKIENHKNWKSVHDYIKLYVEKFGISSKSDINKKGNSFIFASTELFYFLKNKITELNLEVLKRKWDKNVNIKYNKLKSQHG